MSQRQQQQQQQPPRFRSMEALVEDHRQRRGGTMSEPLEQQVPLPFRSMEALRKEYWKRCQIPKAQPGLLQPVLIHAQILPATLQKRVRCADGEDIEMRSIEELSLEFHQRRRKTRQDDGDSNV